ncbi:MAG: cytochrome d ubiquinol oxidase subunit II [Rothia sp. (in: high G+C Gram-positive bacteria)]|uniref:cytochrome d ubiquinol oxidase subunit II n=1 Tax=Rothia sp. (in: high G+C Gram-positive bacteria) TaxID=1885016 RepID=UPI0026E0FDEA|nr:cytochrome d ubiquinol oxidase subunit II [Rothia sp. (in: high G+C Gram-positive bacteria)]MDO5750802.1 cytochrome d ubiquinol oxidase subunit II [Rothia sp. (in: high G+C Gram-positive bacteria)]
MKTSFSFDIFANQPALPTLWFLIIGVFWVGYLILDTFDLGVGMLMSRFFARNEKERRLLLNTIGPLWDGNEVWLVTGGAAIFAAFPLWYASLFSALYIPLTLALVALIFRVVAIEYRGKKNDERWIKNWNIAIVLSSLFIALLVGALLALTTTGLPINAHQDRVGGPFVWATFPYIAFVLLGGLGLVGFSLAHGLAFIALKTDGEVRDRARTAFTKWVFVLVLPLVLWVLHMDFHGGNGFSWIFTVLAVIALVWAWISARGGREGRAFSGMALFVAFGTLAIFMALFPNVLPSTIDPAYSLTISNASGSEYTLGVMTWVGLGGLPFVLAYQTWTFWVFRKRLHVDHIPEAHDAYELAEMPNRTK